MCQLWGPSDVREKGRAAVKVRNKQCKACPWRVDTVPDQDIPNGYSRRGHAALEGTIAEPGRIVCPNESMRLMACHESDAGNETPCVGWVSNQLGPGNNIGLRLMARDGRFNNLELDGPQHEKFDETLGEIMGDCPECGNAGFSKPGTTYGDVCDYCGGQSASADGMPIRFGGVKR